MTKLQAKAMYEHYCKIVEKLTEAMVALIDGGVQSYSIDGRSLTKFDLDKLSDQLDKAIKKRDEYKAIMDGKKPRKAVGVVPRDI